MKFPGFIEGLGKRMLDASNKALVQYLSTSN